MKRKKTQAVMPYEIHAAAWFLGRLPETPMALGAAPERVFIEDRVDDAPDPALVARASASKWDDCANYAGCLDYAARLDWDQWSCKPCPVFSQAIPGETFEVSIKVDDPSDHLYSINRGGRRGMSSGD